jgi:hypothetical protein
VVSAGGGGGGGGVTLFFEHESVKNNEIIQHAHKTFFISGILALYWFSKWLIQI